MINALKIILFLTAIVLVYFIYESIEKYPRHDAKIKTIYTNTAEHLTDIANSQMMYKDAKGGFAPGYDSLNLFIQTAQIRSINDSTVMISVKDSLFKGRELPKLGVIKTEYGNVPIEMRSNASPGIDSADAASPFFIAWVTKAKLLNGFEEEIVTRERLSPYTNQIIDDSLSIGSLSSVSTEGNWPAVYDRKIAKKQKK